MINSKHTFFQLLEIEGLHLDLIEIYVPSRFSPFCYLYARCLPSYFNSM